MIHTASLMESRVETDFLVIAFGISVAVLAGGIILGQIVDVISCVSGSLSASTARLPSGPSCYRSGCLCRTRKAWELLTSRMIRKTGHLGGCDAALFEC